MAVRNIAQTDTLETFRTQFNALAADDFGDIGTLDASLTATSVIGAVNEINSVVQSAAGWFIEDANSAVQAVGSGQTLSVLGTGNQITAVVSSPDKLTVGLSYDVTIPNDLTVTGDITSVGGDITVTGNILAANVTTTGTTQILGSVQIVGNTISCIDSTLIKIDDGIEVLGPLDVVGTIVAGVITINSAGSNDIESSGGTLRFGADIELDTDKSLFFEGATANDFETKLTVTDPTADHVITLPAATGTVALTETTGYATSSIFTTSSTLNIYNSGGVLQKTIVGSAT